MKINTGEWIESIDNTKRAYIKLDTHNLCLRDLAIGLGAIIVGALYLTISSFKSGGRAYSDSLSQAEDAIGVIIKETKL